MSILNRLRAWAAPLKPCGGGWWESEIRDCDRGIPGGRVGQPVNAWTNIAYGIGGIGVAVIVATIEAYVFAAAMAMLMFGSFMYHAFPSVKTAAVDHAGMYAVFGALTTYAVGYTLPLTWLFMVVGAGCMAYLFQYAFNMNLDVMMGVFLWFCSLAIGNNGGNIMVMGFAWILFGGAMVAWQLDKRRILTRRWGHGIWHVFTAAAITLMFVAI